MEAEDAASKGKLGLYQPRRQDPSFVVWFVGQRDKGRSVKEVDTRSDHALWIGYRNESALQSAINAHGYANLAGDRL